MSDITPKTTKSVAAARAKLGISDERFPHHVAVIMDGNGRWARQRGLPRPMGHHEGAKIVRVVVQAASDLGLEALSLYGFSLENWRRPNEEVEALLTLFSQALRRERPTIMQNNIRFRHLGRRDGLPKVLLDEIDRTTENTRAHTGMWLNLALNYGSRTEIVDAIRALCARVTRGELSPQDIDERTVSDALGTAGQTDPDMIIRTAGEMRISNFLLWQVSYAEFVVTDVLWPDFNEQEFHKCIAAFAGRNRRFGGLDKP
jgi:undecaprenyl diphosphate synthase